MNPEEELGFVADDEIGFVEDAPRMQPTRRTVLGTTHIVAGGPTTYDPSGERQVVGHEVDADAPIATTPEPSWQERGKAAPTAPTREQRARWEVARGRTSDGGETPSAVWDALVAGTSGPLQTDSGARTRERAQSFWDQFTSGDARLGGRNSIDPIVGEDLRAEAPIAAVFQSLPIHIRDDAERQRVEGRAARARSQAPELAHAGDAAAIGGYLLAPNPATAAGRIGLGAGIGAAVAGSHSLDSPVEDALIGGGLGAGFGVLGEGIATSLAAGGPLRAAAARLRRGADASQEVADQALLEAGGFWGQRAIDQIDRAGGPARVASDFRRFGIGRGGNQAIPRMQQAAQDLETLGRGGGDTMREVARAADDAGARIPTQRVIEAAENEARRLDQLGTATAQRAAQRIRSEVAPLAQRGEMTLSEAWALRRHFDSMADFSAGAGADDVARTAGEQFRALRGHLDREMDSALQSVGWGREWDEASRMAQLGIISREAGAGARRLSVGGGMGGANATGDLVADAISTGNPLRVAAAIPQTILARAAGQEARMVAPGAIARVRQASADTQRNLSQRLYELARSQPQQLGRFARPLIEAGQRGAAALSATHYVLAQREREYRDLIEQLGSGEEQ